MNKINLKKTGFHLRLFSSLYTSYKYKEEVCFVYCSSSYGTSMCESFLLINIAFACLGVFDFTHCRNPNILLFLDFTINQ